MVRKEAPFWSDSGDRADWRARVFGARSGSGSRGSPAAAGSARSARSATGGSSCAGSPGSAGDYASGGAGTDIRARAGPSA